MCVSDYFLDGQLSRRLTFGWRQFPPAYLSYQATMKEWNNSSKVSRYISIFCRKSVHIVCCPYFSVFPLTWTSCQTLVCHIKENFLQTLKKIFFFFILLCTFRSNLDCITKADYCWDSYSSVLITSMFCLLKSLISWRHSCSPSNVVMVCFMLISSRVVEKRLGSSIIRKKKILITSLE